LCRRKRPLRRSRIIRGKLHFLVLLQRQLSICPSGPAHAILRHPSLLSDRTKARAEAVAAETPNSTDLGDAYLLMTDRGCPRLNCSDSESQ
jgi:hypothetical protein